VLYPGSIERTSIAEADEAKGFMIVDLTCDGPTPQIDWQFRHLPARPLVRRELVLEGVAGHSLEAAIGAIIADCAADAVLTLRVVGTLTDHERRVLAAANLRRLAPPKMNVELKLEDEDGLFVRPISRSRPSDEMLELPL
jgi:DNA repair exonuclease SbcCD nuclease subunit